ncbi:MAG: glutamate-1-semialdehyde 2,1-aminomutase [Snodgrassella sp.]|nr:glutamate-1-semialdehyde 2,1-aminomutase [Snodgrassella sp.]
MNNNSKLLLQAQKIIPGGVNSPVRAFGSVSGVPRFIHEAKDAHVWDEEQVQYIDYIGSWGTAIVGHAHPEVVDAVCHAAQNGLSFGAPTADEICIAEMIQQIMPSMEKIRLVSSGTEATMSAIRLARGFTGRDNIIKFEGCYHGHSDSLLVKAGSGLLTFGHPSSAGVPKDLSRHTIVLPYNNVAALEQLFAQQGDSIACVIVEPIAGNMNMIPASNEFVQALRSLTDKYGSILIYDEIMTGFRVALGGAQSIHGITPDLTTVGKVIGGGMPVAAFGGRADIMECISPLGNVYQAGTLSGNPVCVAAGLKTLEIIQRDGFYRLLSARTQELSEGLCKLAREAGLPFSSRHIGGMFGFYFITGLPECYEDIQKADLQLFKQFFHAMLARGVLFAPSAFEAGFVSAAHSPEIIADTLSLAAEAFTEISREI